MKKTTFNINIDAPADRVYDVMLGISNKETYEQWTAPFNPTSTYEGSWDKEARSCLLEQMRMVKREVWFLE